MKKRIIWGIISLLFIPNVLLAADFSIKMNCPESAAPGEKISCSITSNIDDKISVIQGSFSVSDISNDNINFVKNNTITYESANANGFRISNSAGIYSVVNTNSFNVGTLEINIPQTLTSSFTVSITNISAQAIGEGGISFGNVKSTVSVKQKSNDNSLKSLKVGKYDLVPAFSSDVLSYKVQAEDVPSILIEAVNDGGATISGAGERKLKYGDNTINIVVTSETGESRTYKIVINRFDSRDKVNTLDNLIVLGYDLDQEFDPKKTTYSVTVPSDVTKVTIKADRTNALDKNKPLSTFVKNYGPRDQKLNYGENHVEVRVRAENEVVKKYTINITRIDDRDPNNNLKGFTLSSGKYKFNKDTTHYIINVENNVSVVSLTCEAESEKAKVVCPASTELKEGSNKINIKVTAENEKEKEYVITINRLKEGTTIEEVENITYLKHLSVKGKNIKFNQKTTTYEIPITKDTDITFEYELFDGVNGTIELKDDVAGPIKLANKRTTINMSPVIDGSIILLNVQSEEGYTRLYTFNVKTADYYIGDIDIPVEKEKLHIKWTWQLIVGLASVAIILCEIGYVIYFAIKNGGVESKRDEVKSSIQTGINNSKEKKAQKEQQALIKAQEKAEKKRLKEEEKAKKEAKKKAQEEAKKQAKLEKENKEKTQEK